MSWKTLKGIRRFKPGEFPENPEEHAEPGLIYALDDFAVALGKVVHPSPVPGALARLDGSETSRHYAMGRRSDAIDVFCACPIFQAWATALWCGWGGIGVCFDTRYRGGLWPMLHLDQRQEKLIWFRDEAGEYHYPITDLDFWQGLSRRLAVNVTMKG